MQRGDVWMVSVPASSGREQSGTRPAIVMQDATYRQSSPLVLVALLTSQLSALRFPAAVQITPSSQNGLTVPSVALVFQTRALDRTRFIRQLGTLTAADLQNVLEELRKLTGL